jgi:hypothetical protein
VCKRAPQTLSASYLLENGRQPPPTDASYATREITPESAYEINLESEVASHILAPLSHFVELLRTKTCLEVKHVVSLTKEAAAPPPPPKPAKEEEEEEEEEEEQ